MDNEKKKSNLGIIIIAIIIILLILFLVWFFLLKGDNKNNSENKDNNTEDNTNTSTDNPTTNPKVEYDYRDGVLTQIVDEEGNPLQTEFVINGIILIGNRHAYEGKDETSDVIGHFTNQGYNKEGINSSFYLNEWVEFYIDTDYNGSDSNVKILITPHKTVEEYQNMSSDELNDLASEKGAVIEYTKPDEDNSKYVGNGYVNMDNPEGKYDILFIYKNKLAYFINVIMTKEE